MDLNRLKYGKAQGEKDVSIPTGTALPVAHERQFSVNGDLPAGNYAKGEPFIETKMLFVISGGSKREKDYFKQLQKDKNITRLKLAFRSKDGQGLVPKQMNDLAMEFVDSGRFKSEDGTFFINIDDVIYLLQDTDEFEPDIRGIFKSGIVSQTQWIVSNPSFEIWLFYHRYTSPDGLLDEGVSKPLNERSQWLKRRLDTLVPGGINPIKAFDDIRKAIQNSKANYNETDGLPGLYATQMHQLADDILKILGTEFDAMMKRKADRIKSFLNHS